jgi:hypothetical protein
VLLDELRRQEAAVGLAEAVDVAAHVGVGVVQGDGPEVVIGGHAALLARRWPAHASATPPPTIGE